MSIVFKIVAAIGFLIALAWVILDLKFDSALAVATTGLALIGAFVVPAVVKKKPNQAQSVSDGSIGIQSAGDVNVTGNIKSSNDDHRAK